MSKKKSEGKDISNKEDSDEKKKKEIITNIYNKYKITWLFTDC